MVHLKFQLVHLSIGVILVAATYVPIGESWR